MEKKIRIYRLKQPKVYKPLTEGEPYCPCCMRHIESCGCLEVVEVKNGQTKQL